VPAFFPFIGGFVQSIKQVAQPRVTTQYPAEKKPKPPRAHGRHVLNRYEDGMEKCIGCELCAAVCPADCIYVRGADNSADAPVSPGERYGFVYEINYLRCIHCDLCVEACPTEAITESKLFEFSFTSRADAIGAAAYEGEVQWSGELGYGVRAPEGGQSGKRDDEATGNISIRTVARNKIPVQFGGRVR
jgi:NADH-quinone oxidoreductase subunit I